MTNPANQRRNQLLESLSEVLSRCSTFAFEIHTRTELNPTEDSQATREWDSPDADRTEVQTSYSYAAIVLSAASNQLEGIARQLVEPIPHLGILAGARAGIENAARAWWLFDPAISVKDRAGRGLADRFYSLHEALKVQRAMHRDDNKFRVTMDRRIRQVTESAERQGFEVAAGRQGKVVRGYSRRSSTDLLTMIHGVEGEVVYRFLSASIHGTAYALLQHLEATEDPRGGMGYTAVPNSDFRLIGWSLAKTIQTFLGAFERQTLLYGWDVSDWRRWEEEVQETLEPLLRRR